MQNLTLVFTIVAVQTFAWLTPGPNFVLIVRNSLVYSRKAGIWTAMGISIASLVHISYSVVGIWLIGSTSNAALNLLKFFGIGYLAYLGIKTLLIKVDPQKYISTIEEHKYISPFDAAKVGFLVNISSPLAPPYFASLFGTIIASGAPLWVVIFLWIALPLNSFVMATLLSLFFTQKNVKAIYTKYQHIVNKLLGLTLLALALMMAFHK
jgi:threonine/homoserine/homoserine lactone efflux protein